MALLVEMFKDQIVSSKDLNRRSGEILRMPEEGPVTIARQGGDLVLMRRDEVRLMVESAATLPQLVKVIIELIGTARAGTGNSHWLEAFALEDQLNLAHELLDAMGSSGKHVLDQVDDLLHEWEESAAWIQNEAVALEIREAIAKYDQASSDTEGPG